MIDLLLESGCPVDSANHLGFTPLHRAALNGRRPAVQVLVSRGASLTTTNHEGNSALHLACHANQLPVIEVRLLLSGSRAALFLHRSLPCSLQI